MPGIVLFSGYEPPAGQLFCAVCTAVYKQRVMAQLQDEILAAARADGEQTTIDLTGLGLDPPALAVSYGLFAPLCSPPMGNGMMPFPVPLCWSHLLALTLTETAIMPAHPGMMPGSGPGGAVMLDQRR